MVHPPSHPAMRGLSAIRTRSEPRSTRASTRLARTDLFPHELSPPYMIGWLNDTTGSFTAGLYGLAGMLTLAALSAPLIKLVRREPLNLGRRGRPRPIASPKHQDFCR